MSPRVLVSIVSYQSGHDLESCLQGLNLQAFRDFSVAVWDNASTDKTADILERHRNVIDIVHLSGKNVGFCAGHNKLIASVESDYVLVLNPDVVLESRFLEHLVRWMDGDPSSGSATGKLLRKTATSVPARRLSDEKIVDSTGIYFVPSQRHFDRGSGETDTGQYERAEYVFGASGAAALYRRAMLEDVRNGSEYFDESFFAYREDVDIAWRAKWMGWNCLYVPEAVGFHQRRVLPENRPTLPDPINMHSFKNRFLLRIKNMDAGTYAQFFIPITLRDLAAFGYVLVQEWSSFPGLPLLFRALPHAWAWRKSIQARRRASPDEIRTWFSYKPVSKQIPDLKSGTRDLKAEQFSGSGSASVGPGFSPDG